MFETSDTVRTSDEVNINLYDFLLFTLEAKRTGSFVEQCTYIIFFTHNFLVRLRFFSELKFLFLFWVEYVKSSNLLNARKWVLVFICIGDRSLKDVPFFVSFCDRS